jgi:hypothetical protein
MIEFLTFLGVWILVLCQCINWFRGENAEGKISLLIHHEFSEAFRAWAKSAQNAKPPLPPDRL